MRAVLRATAEKQGARLSDEQYWDQVKTARLLRLWQRVTRLHWQISQWLRSLLHFVTTSSIAAYVYIYLAAVGYSHISDLPSLWWEGEEKRQHSSASLLRIKKGSRLNVKLKTAINPKGIHQLANQYRWLGSKDIQIYSQTVIARTGLWHGGWIRQYPLAKGGCRTLGGVCHPCVCVCVCVCVQCALMSFVYTVAAVVILCRSQTHPSNLTCAGR